MGRAYSLKDLIDVQGTPRTVRAYAFLNASLTVADNSTDPARDVLDCFLPFVAAGVGAQRGHQLDFPELQRYLRTQFGFNIPLYALTQFCTPLAERGHLLWDGSIRAHICVGNSGDFLREQTQALTSFDDLDASLAQFAQNCELSTPPHSPTWLDALVNFLRGLPEERKIKPTSVKGVITSQGPLIEQYVVGQFVEYCYRNNASLFNDILSVFKGVLIEDFISGDFQASISPRPNDLVVYYDTALLMRLLGCSGKLLGEASHELHRYFQDMGCSTQFLPVNEAEVHNIISAIIGARDFGASIYGETGEAISRSEYSISELRMLNGSVAEKLASFNVFEAKNTINHIHNPQRFQIDEAKFSLVLQSEAEKRGGIYKPENIRHDSQALGMIMMYRRGHTHRDLMKSKYVFVTHNRLLSSVARKFLVKENSLREHECPPILHVGQLTTIMWLLKNRGLEDKLVTRELLANCYAAYRPDSEWLNKFHEAVVATEQSGEKISDDVIVLQAARRIAQDQTFGRSALIAKAPIVEILAKAKKEKEALAKEQNELGRELGATQAREEIAMRQQALAYRYAHMLIGIVERVAILVALAVLVATPFQPLMSPHSAIALSVVGLPIAALSLLDLFGVKLISPTFDRLRNATAHAIFRIIGGEQH